MNDNPQHYLGYLDKEMTIMGILSAFCLAVPSLFLERVLSMDHNSIAHDFVESLYSDCLPCLVTGLILLLIAAMFFYRQRSQLAWYYGQIALEIALPKYTQHRLEYWLQEADSWEAWLPYNTAYWLCIVAGIEITLATLAVYVSLIQVNIVACATAPIVVLVLLLLWLRRNSTKFKYENQLPYFRIR